jgi:hypothetical protein
MLVYVKMELAARVLGHPKVQAVKWGDGLQAQNLARVFIKAFDNSGNQFPIDFDEARAFLGYSNKANALRKLKGGQFQEGLDYAFEDSRLEGRPFDKYSLTQAAFEHFAMSAPSAQGKAVRGFFIAVRDAYIELTRRNETIGVSRGDGLVEAYMKTLDNTTCFYIGKISDNLCKFGITENLRRRVGEHKRTFAPDFSFCLIGAWASSQHKRVKTSFKAHTMVRENMVDLNLQSGKQTKIVKFSPLFKQEHAVENAKHLALTLRLDDMSWNGQVDIEKEKTKQFQIESDAQTERERLRIEAETERYRLRLEYVLKSRQLGLPEPMQVDTEVATGTDMQVDGAARTTEGGQRFEERTRRETADTYDCVPGNIRIVRRPEGLYFSAYDIIVHAKMTSPGRYWKRMTAKDSRLAASTQMITFNARGGDTPGIPAQGVRHLCRYLRCEVPGVCQNSG